MKLNIHTCGRERLLSGRDQTGNLGSAGASRYRRRGQRGFTMIEIAIALGVIVFAMVAIIGVLPIGLNVQRDNRAETIINQDATYWMETIRGGAQGHDDLTNYVDSIQINGTYFTNYFINPGAALTFRTGAEIVGLLSTPNAGPDGVQAIVRTISGAGTEKATRADYWEGQDLAVRYRFTSRVNRVDPAVTQDFNSAVSGVNEPLDYTLYNIQLQFNWPVFGNNTRPTRGKTYNSMASRYLTSNSPSANIWFYYLTP